MMDVLLLRFKVNVIMSQEYQRFLPPVSEQELCERITNVFQRLGLQRIGVV